MFSSERSSTVAMTVDILSHHSGKAAGLINKNLGTDIGAEAIEGTNVPQKLVPYLHRIRTSDIMEYLESEANRQPQEPDRKLSMKRCAWSILKLRYFDSAMGLVILFNLLVMIIETDYSVSEENTSGRSLFWTEVVGLLVLLLFVLELFIRLAAFRCLFWKDSWNVFDFVIVVVDCIFSVIGLVAGTSFPVSILRIFRLAKLARVFKVLRVFPELRLLLAGLISAISAIFWGTLLLFFCMLVWALVAVLVIHPLNKSIDYEHCERCSRAYSSVMQSTLTFWQAIVTGDSWGQVTVPLIERYPGTALYFIAVYLSVGMAVTNLILGVVVNVAQQAQDALSEEDNTDRALKKLARHTHLLQLCKGMDSDGDGMLTHDEVFAAFDTPGDFHDTITALDITREDFDVVWTIIDNGKKGYASYKELVSFLSSVRTSDTQFMLSYVKHYITLLKEALLEKMEEAVDIGHRLQEDVHEIEGHEEQILKDERVLQDRQSQLLAKMEEAVDIGHRLEDDIHEIEGQERQILKDEMLLQDHQSQLLGVAHHSCEMIESIAAQLDLNGQRENAERVSQRNNAQPESQDRVGASDIIQKGSSVNPNTHMTSYVKSPKGDNAMLTAFNHLHDDVCILQSELKSILKDIDCKLDQQVSQISATDRSIMRPPAHSDLLVVPVRRPSSQYSPICCTSRGAATQAVD